MNFLELCVQAMLPRTYVMLFQASDCCPHFTNDEVMDEMKECLQCFMRQNDVTQAQGKILLYL